MGIKDIPKAINDAIDNALSDRKFRRKAAETMKQTIKKRTRSGKGVEKTGGPQTKLRALEKKTKDERRRLSRLGELSKNTSPTKSNLTRTGRLLDNLKISTANGEFEVLVDSKDEQKAKEIADQGRPFMNLSKKELQLKIKMITDQINKHLQKIKLD